MTKHRHFVAPVAPRSGAPSQVLWVPQTRLTSCDLLIFVEEAREPVESADASRVIWPLFWECA